MAVSKNTTKNVVPPVDPALPPVDPALPPVDPALPPVDPALSAEEIAANQAAADAAFKAANDSAPERIAKEEAILNMSNEELNEEFGVTVPEAIGILRDALSRSKSLFIDKMNGLLDKIEETSQL